MKHTPQKTLSKWILGILLISGILLSGVFFAANNFLITVRPLSGTGWPLHEFGRFNVDIWNHWELLFWAIPSGASWASLFVDNDQTPPKQVLTWSFWSQTIGWIQLMDINVTPREPPPGESFNGVFDLSWYAWNDQAGWIDFSTVEFIGGSVSFSGYAWNDGIWWLDMNDASLDLTSEWLQWKVKIIWNLWWGSSFDSTYMLSDTNNAKNISASTYINTIRKNIALLTRNATTQLNTSVSNNRFNTTRTLWRSAIYKNTTSDPRQIRLSYQTIKSEMDADTIDSVIVIGWDVYIDQAVNDTTSYKNRGPKAIIAIKDEYNRWGNIYIQWNITRIYASLIAEWSVYSWYWASGQPKLYNNDPASVLSDLPNTQLHVYGSIISNNTIWWYFFDDTNNNTRNICPTLISDCSPGYAIKYDFNWFRDFHSAAPGATKWYPTDAYDKFSFIIEYNPRILSDPPPWLATQN